MMSATAPDSLWTAADPGALESRPGIDVWRWRNSDAVPDLSILSSDERQRAARMERRAGRRFIANRSNLRRILATRLACRPGDILLGYSTLGRPFLVDPSTSLDFNLSHSADLAVLAVSDRGPLGIDIEYRRAIADPLAVARRTLPLEWVDELSQLARGEMETAFFRFWTRFEACQKADARGIFSPRAPGSNPGDDPVLAFTADQDCPGHLCAPGAGSMLTATRFRDYRSQDQAR